MKRRGLLLREACRSCGGFPRSGQRWLARGAVVCRQGEPADALCLVVSGVLRETCAGSDGRELDTRLAGPGAVVGSESLLPDGHFASTVSALTRARVCRVPIGDVRQRLDADPEAARALVMSLADEARQLRAQVQRLLRRSADERLMHLLTELLGGAPSGAWHELTLGRLELGALCGIDRATVSRALHRLARRGRIELLGRRVRLLE